MITIILIWAVLVPAVAWLTGAMREGGETRASCITQITYGLGRPVAIETTADGAHYVVSTADGQKWSRQAKIPADYVPDVQWLPSIRAYHIRATNRAYADILLSPDGIKWAQYTCVWHV